MPTPFVIIGAGGLAREVLEAFLAGTNDPSSFQGFLSDPVPPQGSLDALSADWLGPVAELASLPVTTRYVVAIGDGKTRQRIDQWALHRGFETMAIVHPSAAIGRDVALGPGSMVLAQSAITTNVRIGRGVCVNPGTSISHDCLIGDYVTISPNAAVCGRVTVHDLVMIGANAVINPDVSLGQGAVVGSGAVVTRDVGAQTTVIGVPARPMALRR